MVSLWPGCLIKRLEKSDWLQGWCIIDEWAWLIENILFTRGRVHEYVGVCGWGKWIHFVWTATSVSAVLCLLFCTGAHWQTFTICAITNTDVANNAIHTNVFQVGPSQKNNLRQSAESQRVLNNSRYLCRETESIVHLPPWWSPAPPPALQWGQSK